MSLGERLFKQRKPRFVFIRTLREIQGTGACLEGCPVFLFTILPVDLQPSDFIFMTFIIIRRTQIEFVINDRVDPLAIYSILR